MVITSEERNKGKEILGKVLKIPKNVQVLEKNIYIIANNNEEIYRDYILEVLEIINSKKVSMVDILKNIKEGKLGFNGVNYDSIRQEIQEENNFILNPFEVEEGVLECKKCGSKKTFSYTKQIRSGDEGTTVMATCVMCRASWTT